MNAQMRGLALQSELIAINTDKTDLTAFSASGGEIIMYHGLNDQLIPVQGSINSYERVLARMGGADAVQDFYRFYLIPGAVHNDVLTTDPTVPAPQMAGGRDELFDALRNWVEGGTAPGRIDVSSRDGRASLPLCVYPQRITYYGGGSRKRVTSDRCEAPDRQAGPGQPR